MIAERDKEISSAYATLAFQAKNVATLESARIILERDSAAGRATETRQAISLSALATSLAAQVTKQAVLDATCATQAAGLASAEITRIALVTELASARATITGVTADREISALSTPSSTLAGTPIPTPTQTATPTPTSTPSPTPSPSLGDTLTRSKDNMVILYAPDGTFQMGSYDGELNSTGREYPKHKVILDGFWIDQTEVTNHQYMLCVADGLCSEPDTTALNGELYYGNESYDNHPVIYVNWDQAKAYCQWAGADLPSEAQWEYAARGADDRIYPWGNSLPSHELAKYGTNGPAEVGSFPSGRSWCGALDMAGNVWEWVNDWFDGNYYAQFRKEPAVNPTGPTDETEPKPVTRVMRGGSWAYDESELRAANRGNNYPYNTFHNVGFRCVVSSAAGP